MEIPATDLNNNSMMSVDNYNVQHTIGQQRNLSQTVVRDEDITIGGAEILSRGASDIIFRTYKPI